MWFPGINYYKLAVEKDHDSILTTIIRPYGTMASKARFSLIDDVLRSIVYEQRRRKCTKHFMHQWPPTMGIADVYNKWESGLKSKAFNLSCLSIYIHLGNFSLTTMSVIFSLCLIGIDQYYCLTLIVFFLRWAYSPPPPPPPPLSLLWSYMF
jgi:hypothetical protein